MITRKTARKNISERIKSSEPIKTGIKLPIRKGETFDVYRIPIEWLAPNIYNDRIAWRIKEYEADNNRELLFDNKEDIEYVYNLILAETPNENKKTKADIAKKGQLNDGIITSDGVIIDGNRRATLIRSLFRGDAKNYDKNLEDFRYFNAIILGDIEKKEIMSLETQIQIGEDPKIGYNPINMYIKVENLTEEGYNSKQIANMMGEKENDIKSRQEIFEVMNQYLEYIDKPSHYTLLEGLEDQFIRTTKMFKKLDNKTYNADWEFKSHDIMNFKALCFDYLRSKPEGKKFRDKLIGGVVKADGVFSIEDTWKKFYDKHEEIIDNSVLDKESDWHQVNSPLMGNLNSIRDDMKEDIAELNIEQTIDRMNTKADKVIENLKDVEELEGSIIDKIQAIERKMYSIRKQFGD